MKISIVNFLYRNKRYSRIAGKLFHDFGEGIISENSFYIGMQKLHTIMSNSGCGILDDKIEFISTLELIGGVLDTRAEISTGRCIGVTIPRI